MRSRNRFGTKGGQGIVKSLRDCAAAFAKRQSQRETVPQVTSHPNARSSDEEDVGRLGAST